MRKVKIVVMGKFAVPLQTEDYLVLAENGIKTTRVSRAFLPTLSHILSAKEIQLEELSWYKVVLRPRFEKVKDFWEKRERCKFAANSKSLVLTGPNVERNKKALIKIETLWREFFNRWGLRCDCTYTETKARIKLVILFSISSNTLPEIPITKEQTKDEDELAVLEFPFVRFKLSLGERFVEIIEEKRIGGEWELVKTHRSAYSDIKEHDFLISLFTALNHKDKLKTL